MYLLDKDANTTTFPSKGYIMLMYRDYITFTVMDKEINLISTETDYGNNIVAEIDDKYYYLGDTLCNLDSAIIAWRQANGRELTSDEFKQVMVDNEII
jgi:hypothetical protein